MTIRRKVIPLQYAVGMIPTPSFSIAATAPRGGGHDKQDVGAAWARRPAPGGTSGLFACATEMIWNARGDVVMTKLWETSPLTDAATAGLVDFAPTIRIADCTLRDGEQQAGIVLNSDDKVAIARKLDELGVYEIEAGTPASSREDRDAVEAIAAAGLTAKVSGLARARRDDVDELAAIGCWGARLSFPISNIQRQAKFAGMSDDKYLAIALEITEYVKERGLECIFSPFDTTRCDLDFLRRVLGEFAKRGTVDRVRVVDTTGCATPHIARYLVKEMKKAGDIPIEAHFHDDFGLAVANTIAAAEAGAEYLSVTMNGIGERAGNASLEETVVALKVLYGVDTGIRDRKAHGGLPAGRGAQRRRPAASQGGVRGRRLRP